MACVIAGTKKAKDEPAPKANANANQPSKPVAQTNNISLDASKGGKEERKKKNCEC